MKIKRGELTTQQLVTIIILIISFVVILFLIFRLNLGETTDKEICHNSVVMRGQSVLKSGALDCKTNYVCISGGGKCDEFNPSITKEIDLSEDNAKDEIMKAIADEMADCWWMFGEGKIDYVGTKFTGDKACALCSIIAFDKNIIDFAEKNAINYTAFYEYLQSTEKERGKTYLSYIYNTDAFDEQDSYFENTFDFSKQYIILTGIAKEGIFWKIFYAPWNAVKSVFIDEDKKTKTGTLPVLIEEKENINDIGCGEFITKA